MLCLTACGETATNNTTSEKPADTTTTAAPEETATESAAEEVTAETVTELVTEEVTTSFSMPPLVVEETTTTAAPMPVLADELSTKYADLDNRSFKYNGKIMTLGASTLQDFVDAGAEFVESMGISNAGMNFDVQIDREFNGQFPYGCAVYHLKLNDTPSSITAVTLYFVNPHNSPCKLRECILAKIKVDLNSISSAPGNNFANELEFAFDRSLTYESLVENSGEPNYEDHGYNYAVVSEKTPEYDSGYEFAIGSDNVLDWFEISWIP